MIHFIFSTGTALGLFAIITILKWLYPKSSYEIKASLKIGIAAIIIFAGYYLILVTQLKWSAFWPIVYFLLSCFYVYKGAKSVPLKTVTGVFSKFTNDLVGRIGAGLNWADPIYEIITANVDGVPNTTIDLQKIKIEIIETPEMHTKTKGIKAKVKQVVFMLEVIQNDIPKLFNIEGGAQTIKERIVNKINFIFLDEIGKLLPTDLDEDKINTLHDLAEEVKNRVNLFCEDNDYPYEIPDNSDLIIGDTELDPEYYKVLAKREYSRLEQQAKDLEAQRLRQRISKFGRDSLPGEPKSLQLEHALISLGIAKKDIQEKKYGVDPTLAQLAKDIVEYLKN